MDNVGHIAAATKARPGASDAAREFQTFRRMLINRKVNPKSTYFIEENQLQPSVRHSTFSGKSPLD
jgi:hypothetical protein